AGSCQTKPRMGRIINFRKDIDVIMMNGLKKYLKMKNMLINIFSFCLLLSLTSGCTKNNTDNSLFFPDFSMENPDIADPETATSLRVSTYNLWVQTGAAWDQRKSDVAKLIQDNKFEICGFEEA